MASSAVYNHRPLQPSSGRSNPTQATGSMSARLVDTLDIIKQEFEAMTSEIETIRSQKDDFESKVASQVAELNVIRRSLYELESQHSKARQLYEDELSRLRLELAAAQPPPARPLGIQGLPSASGSQSQSSDAVIASASASARHEAKSSVDGDDRRRPREFNHRERDREVDRAQDGRDPKRLKTKNESGQFTPSLSSASALKLPPSHTLYAPRSSSSHGYDSPDRRSSLPPLNVAEEFTLQSVPPEYKKEGPDWFAVFNPKLKKALDINLVHTFIHTSVVCCVQFSADGRYLATGCNRTAQIYDTKTGEKVCVLVDENVAKQGDLYIRSVRFSPDGKLLATGAEDRQIRIWDIAKKRIRHIFDGHQQEIYSLDFSKDGRLIVSGSGDKTTRIWDMYDKSCKILTISDADSLNNDAGVTSVAISPDATLVAAGSLDSIVRVWDVASGTLLERLRGHRDSVYSVAFTPDGKGLVSGSLDKSLKYWDVSVLATEGARIKTENATRKSTPTLSGRSSSIDRPAISPCTMDFVGHKDYVLSVSVPSDNRWVVSGSKDRCVHFWDARNASLQFLLQGHKNSVISLDLNLMGGLLATGSGDSLARIWSYNTV
ncbi:hypothetical protein K443DRAFT_3143 [Laccaria amethystina LaAM-08-1]|uniref:Transcriptional repressor Tup1 N-terminal domain-containing protein n=1 Tax=Laccaria amethystina LaAM-08-1 TaxID=1095629 RepID=A0A0C9Y830_9AGAR|nr:hypothetical protein K443DRAFT_3143 [Laccaria amethystina LaAM-08-1]